MSYRLITLFVSIFITFSSNANPQLAKNKFRDNAKQLSQSIEKLIQQHLSLIPIKDQLSVFDVPHLAKDYGVSIRNPFSQLPNKIYQAFAAKGIDLKAMSKYKSLYISGNLRGSNSIKLINTDATTVLVIGSNTSTHNQIFSRGPVVVLGKSYLMEKLYAKDFIWFGELASANAWQSDVIGLPSLSSSPFYTNFTFGVSPYSVEEELHAIAKLGKEKTHYSKSDLQSINETLKIKTSGSSYKTPLKFYLPSIEQINETQKKHNYCKYYAKTAVEQNKKNIQLKCGFKGSRWNNDKQGQEKWCLNVLDIVSQEENTARKQKLKTCFINKTSSNNPENKLNLPATCISPNKAYKPVKSIFTAYRYRQLIKQVIDNGLIQYDYNKDGKKDFVFIEQAKNKAQVSLCISDQTVYQRLKTNMIFSLDEGVINSEDYNVSQNKDELVVEINLFSHNEGSSHRITHFRYNASKQKFEVTNTNATVSGVFYDGKEYPMAAPIEPIIY